MKPIIKYSLIVGSAVILLGSFAFMIFRPESSHQQMLSLLDKVRKRVNDPNNPFKPETTLLQCDSLLAIPRNQFDINLIDAKALYSLRAGNEQDAVNAYRLLVNNTGALEIDDVMHNAGIAYMRLGERTNCMLGHNRSSCIFPIKDGGVHTNPTGSLMAIKTYQSILTINPNDLVSRWLLNIAYMTLGRYPKDVPPQFLIPDLDKDKSGEHIKPFTDMAGDLSLNIFGRAGGVIIDDFNNDGYLDIVTSGWDLDDPMHYFRNNQDGTFTDVSEQSGLKQITGGLTIQQVDYNNDGKMDIFVLRGAWNSEGYGNQPSSLLRNNGDGTFTDVTTSAGLLYLAPTQAAAWADYNNDGWLDVFVGAEDSGPEDKGGRHPCALYINNHDGTFTNVTAKANLHINAFVKGVTTADYNNDGKPDVYLSTMGDRKYLLKNTGSKDGVPQFEDVTDKAGVNNPNKSFTTWFFDYNNDGWPDLMLADYSFKDPLSKYSAAEALGKPIPNAGNIYMYRNNHDGTFTNVTKEMGLDKVVYSMGANFGDIDNDGYLDMYFGTGNPDFKSLVPNKMFRNVDGKRFADITVASRTGNLQKGHGVAFGDLRNNGLQDIFAEIGGAYKGDSYNSSLYVNPGQNNNNWISLKLEGVKANKSAVGSRITLTFTENGVKRMVYKDVNSGGSFGSSPLRQEIGIGQAKVIDDIEIRWAGSGTVQHFRNVAPRQFLHITEGDNKPEPIQLKRLTFLRKADAPMCMPTMAVAATK